LVPCDLILLTTGTRIPADARLVSSYSIGVDESSLTGESIQVDKSSNDEVYAGTLVISGEGKALVVSTGLSTKLGRLSVMAEAIKPPKTQLQLAMKSLSKTLVFVALAFSILIPLFGLLSGKDFREMILTGLALAFATIPEELPIIITMILGLGSYKLSKENLLIKKIKATEVLGDATVILTDKTGTITENKMRVAFVYPLVKQESVISTALEALTDLSVTPTDNAIRLKASELGLKSSLNSVFRERSFGNNRKTKSIIRLVDGKLLLITSGAPEEVLRLVKGDNKAVISEVSLKASDGMRVIAIASKVLRPADKGKDFKILEHDMTFRGLISLEDPPRAGVKETIDLARRAGIRTIMVTGDHKETARYIALKVGISGDNVLTGVELDKLSDEQLREAVKSVSIFARTSPEHKYRLVNALQANGEVVAVTGDGVNDSLALKGADIGIAMGIKGTDAAKEAADIVLADDNYATISHGIFEGRKFYDNLRKGVKYYLGVKVALVAVFLMPLIIGLPLPFAPIQIIILELFMDLAASAGFVSEPAEKSVFYNKPKKKRDKFLDKFMIRGVFVSGFSLFAAVSVTYLFAVYSGFSVVVSQSYAFTAWIMGHLILAFISRSEREPLFSLKLWSNRLMNFWALAVIAFLLLVNLVPFVSSQLRLVPLGIPELGIVFVISLVSIGWRELVKFFV
ncbi:MAG TPA: cation-transporting P-type ATPase, partial [Candidatus Nanoarchaeia archaeon]|nr:cation-transporting P-type ATPase [Candidatus Nanoarchaeia archaeon]